MCDTRDNGNVSFSRQTFSKVVSLFSSFSDVDGNHGMESRVAVLLSLLALVVVVVVMAAVGRVQYSIDPTRLFSSFPF